MPPRLYSLSLFRTSTPYTTSRLPLRTLHTHLPLRQSTPTPTSAPKKRPTVGTIKGTLFGFLLGSTISGALSYFYLLEEYRTANELLTEDVEALRASILRIEQYVRNVEERFIASQKSGGELVKRR